MQPLHVRIAHWTNAIALPILAWSGFSLFATERSYRPIVHALPNAVWSGLHLAGHRDLGRAWHMGLAIVFLVNAATYVATSIASGTWRRLVPRGERRGHASDGDYTEVQRAAYSFVMAAGAIIIVSGVALWAKHVVPLLPLLFRNEFIAHTVHVVAALALIAFTLVHVVQVARAGMPTFLGMLTGTTSPPAPLRRRSLALGASVVAATIAAFAIANVTSGPTGIPAFLRWAVGPPDAHRAERQRPAAGTVASRS